MMITASCMGLPSRIARSRLSTPVLVSLLTAISSIVSPVVARKSPSVAGFPESPFEVVWSIESANYMRSLALIVASRAGVMFNACEISWIASGDSIERFGCFIAYWRVASSSLVRM